MIDKIELENFQSHKKSILEFVPGINAIIGPSNNGKTSIIRALKLLRYNQPSGTAYISKWARDKKGHQTKQMSIVVTRSGHKLTRGKGSELNGYQIDNNDPLEALGKGGLPNQVIHFFNTTEVNLQEQLDKPFLIGSTPPEIAKFLNTIVDMTEIDVYLSSVDSKKRSTTKDLKRVSAEIEDLGSQSTRFNKLEDVQILLERLSKISNSKTQKVNDKEVLQNLVQEYITLQKKSNVWCSIDSLQELIIRVQDIKNRRNTVINDQRRLSDAIILYKTGKQTLIAVKEIPKIEKLLTNLKDTKKEIKDLNIKWGNLSSAMSQFRHNTEILEKSVDTDEIKTLLKDLEKVQKSKRKIIGDLWILQPLITNFKLKTTLIINNNNFIQDLEKQLPDICPICGTPLKRKKI